MDPQTAWEIFVNNGEIMSYLDFVNAKHSLEDSDATQHACSGDKNG